MKPFLRSALFFCSLSFCVGFSALSGHAQATENKAHNGTIAITVSEDGWGGAQHSDILVLLGSATKQITKGMTLDKDVRIHVVHVPSGQDVPVTLAEPAENAKGNFTVELNCGGRYWSQYAYQFAHEFVHVLARAKSAHPASSEAASWKPTRHQWLEETLAGTASMFVLREMSRDWKTNPPYPNWADYAASLASYEKDVEAEYAGQGMNPKSLQLGAWVGERIETLEGEAKLTSNSRFVAVGLLADFEKQPQGWEAVQYLDTDADKNVNLRQHLKNWVSRCPKNAKGFARQISARLGVVVP